MQHFKGVDDYLFESVVRDENVLLFPDMDPGSEESS